MYNKEGKRMQRRKMFEKRNNLISGIVSSSKSCMGAIKLYEEMFRFFRYGILSKKHKKEYYF